MILLIGEWLIWILTLLIGFGLGYIAFYPGGLDYVNDKIRRLHIPKRNDNKSGEVAQAGPIVSPSPRQQWLNRHPATKAEEEAMSELISKELNEGKD